jgi:hypothetical protein
MKIEERFNSWLTIKKDYYNSMSVTPRELNERFKLLSKPFDTYCKQNYIDFNFIVDQILQMSLPYSEGKANQDKMGTGSHDHTFYEPSVHVIKGETTTNNNSNIHSSFHLGRDHNNIIPQNLQSNNIPNSSSNINFFSSGAMENMYFNQGNFIKTSPDNIQGSTNKPIIAENNLNTFNQLNNMPSMNMNNMNMNNSINFGRGDSFNNLIRDGSFINWENNERFLPSRGISQNFNQYLADEPENETRNFFSKNNAFRNVSVQSVTK